MSTSAEGHRALFSGDRPLDDPGGDRLGYAPFAEHLADAIARLGPPQGFVIALQGPWGSGKSTLLNFLRHYLNTRHAADVVPFSFDPWWFAGADDLMQRFFRELTGKLKAREERAKDLVGSLAGYADALSHAPIPGAGFGGVVGSVLRSLAGRGKPAQVQKARVSRALEASDRKLVVLIDNLDRLSAAELVQMFSMVKAVADFPRVTYVLAFERRIVATALDGAYSGGGEAYLDKIVQAAFDLPPADRLRLYEMVSSLLHEVLAGRRGPEIDPQRWENVVLKGLLPLLKTPRDVVRLANHIRLTFPLVADEVNPTDFIGVEALRVFSPATYGMIRRNSHAFLLDHEFDGMFQSKQDERRKFHDEWLAAVPSECKAAIQALVIELFPRLSGIWSSSSYGADWEQKWRNDLRVCARDRFEVYFRLTLPPTLMPRGEKTALLTLASEPEAFGARFLELVTTPEHAGSSRLFDFVNSVLQGQIGTVSESQRHGVVRALCNVADDIARQLDRASLRSGWPVEVLLEDWALGCLRGLSHEERIKSLLVGMQSGRSTTFITSLVVTLGQQHGLYGAKEKKPVEEQDVREEAIGSLQSAALKTIRCHARDGTLLSAPRLATILARWEEWGDPEEARRWVALLELDDRLFLRLLQALASRASKQGVGDAVATEVVWFDTVALQRLLDTAGLKKKASLLLEDRELPAVDRDLLTRFVRDVKKMEEGKGTSRPSMSGELT